MDVPQRTGFSWREPGKYVLWCITDVDPLCVFCVPLLLTPFAFSMDVMLESGLSEGTGVRGSSSEWQESNRGLFWDKRPVSSMRCRCDAAWGLTRAGVEAIGRVDMLMDGMLVVAL